MNCAPSLCFVQYESDFPDFGLHVLSVKAEVVLHPSVFWNGGVDFFLWLSVFLKYWGPESVYSE